MLIPTQGKSKVYAGWSYPIGSEIVSTALSQVAQYEAIYLRFSMPLPSENLSLGNVDYTPLATTMVEQNWSIDICAVPSMHRTLAKELLIERVLPRFKIWLELLRPPIWYDTWQGLSVAFDLETEQIEYREARLGQ